MMASRQTTLLAAIALCAAGLPALARADEPGVIQVKVPIADLDLTTEAGQRALRTRIHRAARIVCAEDYQSSSLWSDEIRACREAAVHQAKEAMRAAVRVAKAGNAVSLEASAVPR